MIPDNAWILRITAAAGTELADPYSYGTVKLLHEGVFLPYKSSLQSHRDRHPARGMAGSGFRPLTNIPHCCLP